jgi:nitrogenase subunit NifH
MSPAGKCKIIFNSKKLTNVMSNKKKLGIWMDHSEAHLIEFKKESSPLIIISTTFNHEDMEAALNRSEQLMHNKRQQQQAFYYQKIGNAIIAYEEVLIFGPTNAKTELLNVLESDLRFKKIKIEVQSADKMTDNQKNAFVKKHFSKD